jgi:hypothetical protein
MAKEYLSQNKVDVNDRDFFKNPFPRAEIEDLLRGKATSEMFNDKVYFSADKSVLENLVR